MKIDILGCCTAVRINSKFMNKIMFKGLFPLLITIVFFSCIESTTYDLAIENVKVFDSENKKVLTDKTILIKADRIYAIVNANSKVKAIKYINGENRLVSPGFIDTHIHLAQTFGDKENAPEYLEKDSVDIYLMKLANTYLEYGITTIVGAGQPEKWLQTSMQWQKNPKPNYPNIYNSGGAIISDEERTPYIGHVEVRNPKEASEKVEEYYNLGIRHIKIYWRLREPEVKAVIDKASELDMYIEGHIDMNIVPIDTVLNFGLRNFEHFNTLALSAFNYALNFRDFSNKYQIKKVDNFNKMLAMRILIFKYIDETPELKIKYDDFINEFAKHKATFSTSIHLFGEILNKTYFNRVSQVLSEQDTATQLNYNPEQLENLNSAYSVMMDYLKKAHDKGIKIRIGTDCSEGGKSFLSELLLLYEANFSMEDILQIATLNGAEAMKIDGLYGSIKSGKKADLIIFEKNPFENYKNILSSKIIIKDGMEYKN